MAKKTGTEAGRRRVTRDGVKLVIHSRDGRIRARDSVGDPIPPRDKDQLVIVKRIIPDAPGTPSVSRTKIAAAARSAFGIKQR